MELEEGNTSNLGGLHAGSVWCLSANQQKKEHPGVSNKETSWASSSPKQRALPAHLGKAGFRFPASLRSRMPAEPSDRMRGAEGGSGGGRA